MNSDKLEKDIRNRVESEEYKGMRITSICSYICLNFVSLEDLRGNPDRWIRVLKDTKNNVSNRLVRR